MKSIAFASKKGGVSKTTSALFTGLYLSKKYRTLLVDLDSQNALTDFFFEDYQDITIFEAFKGDVPFRECIHTFTDTLSVIPNKLTFDEINHWNKAGKEFILKDELKHLESEFDYIVIDTPPSLNTETVIGLVCADVVVIPARLEKMDTRAIDFTVWKIENEIRKYFNPDLKEVFMLGTQYNYQNRTVNDISYQMLQEKYEDKVLPFKIPYSSKISQMNYVGYSDESVKIPEYEELIKVVENV